MVLSSVSEMDHFLKEILLKIYDNKNKTEKAALRKQFVDHIYPKTPRPKGLATTAEKDLLENDRVTSGALYIWVNDNIADVSLTVEQLKIWNLYKDEILKLRNTAAHAREIVCPAKKQAAMFNVSKGISYYRGDIDSICKVLVKHESNIIAIHGAFVK